MSNTYLSINEQINRICLNSSSEEELLTNVLDGILEEFQCDRAWFLSPCDPSADSCHVAMERTRPEWPGAFAAEMEIPVTPHIAELFKRAIKSKKATVSDVKSDQTVPDWADGGGSVSEIRSTLAVGHPSLCQSACVQ